MSEVYKWGALAISYEGARLAHTSFLNRKWAVTSAKQGSRTILRTRLPSSGKIAWTVGRGAFQAGSGAAKLGAKFSPPAARFLGRGAPVAARIGRPIAAGFGRGALFVGRKVIVPVSIGFAIKGAARGLWDSRNADSGGQAFLSPVRGAARGFFLWK